MLKPQLTSDDSTKGKKYTKEDVSRHGSKVVNNLALGDSEDDPKHLEKAKGRLETRVLAAKPRRTEHHHAKATQPGSEQGTVRAVPELTR